MIVRYKNTFADLLWFAVYTHTHSPVLLCAYSFFGAFSFYSASTAVPTDAKIPARVFVTAIIFLLLLGVFSLIFVLVMVLSLISKANRTILTDHTITICEDGLIEETQFNRTTQKWFGVPRLVRTRKYIFVYVSQNGAHVIPRRAFPDVQAFDQFYVEVSSRVVASTKKSGDAR